MRTGLSLTMVAGLALAVLARTPLSLGLLLLAAGTSNSLTQPAANLLLVEWMRPRRMGFAMAIKQAGMPMASLIGGVLVPAVAVTVGWRWAYVIAAAIAALALFALPTGVPALVLDPDGDVEADAGVEPDAGPEPDAQPGRSDAALAASDPSAPDPARLQVGRRPDLSTGLLVFYGVVGLLGASAAGVLTSFLVTAAEAAGVAEGPAGLLLTVGSAVGITSRVIHGRMADGPRLLPIRRVILLFTVGAAGMGIMAFDRPLMYLLSLLPVFGAGWAWPGLFQLSVVRNNPSAPAAATGISQTGIYVGAAAGPVVGGLVAEAWGYPTLWALSGAVMMAAAALGQVLRLQLRRRRDR
jgi:predicted MFS family arabinose efflux permease